MIRCAFAAVLPQWRGEIELELPDGATVTDALALAAARLPVLGPDLLPEVVEGQVLEQGVGPEVFGIAEGAGQALAAVAVVAGIIGLSLFPRCLHLRLFFDGQVVVVVVVS